MHELSVCLALLAQVERIAAEHDARLVSRVHLRVGPLSGVESALLRQAWPLAAAGTVAGAAALAIATGDVVVSCTACGSESTVTVNRLLCAHCGDFRTRLVSGDELLLERVELGVSPTSARAAPAGW